MAEQREWRVFLKRRHVQEGDAPEPRVGDAIVLKGPPNAPLIVRVDEVLPPTDGDA
jgi:hypothetical protein